MSAREMLSAIDRILQKYAGAVEDSEAQEWVRSEMLSLFGETVAEHLDEDIDRVLVE